MERLLLRPHGAAEWLGLGRSTVYELIASGALPSITTIGRSRRVPLEALRAWVRAQTDAGALGRVAPASPGWSTTSGLAMPAERPFAQLQQPPRRGLGAAPIRL